MPAAGKVIGETHTNPLTHRYKWGIDGTEETAVHPQSNPQVAANHALLTSLEPLIKVERTKNRQYFFFFFLHSACLLNVLTKSFIVGTLLCNLTTFLPPSLSYSIRRNSLQLREDRNRAKLKYA